MSKTALFIRHQAQPGRRDDVRRIWEQRVKPRVEANPAHEAYYFCYDSSDPDVICVFQLYTSEESMQEFLSGSWYPAYLSEVSQVVAAAPQISPATLVWNKLSTVHAPRSAVAELGVVRRCSRPPEMNSQEQAAKFIVFAIQQANEAQEFGFTRNECCRNLKIALHQYWQNKILGHHGQAHKKRIPRSKAALNRPDKECIVEHVMSQMELVNRLMDMDPLTEAGVIELLTNCFRVMVVTREEHALLNLSGLSSTMPHGWDGSDVFARYAALGIEAAAT